MASSAMRAFLILGLVPYILAVPSVEAVSEEQVCSYDDAKCAETKTSSLVQSSHTKRWAILPADLPPRPPRPPRPDLPSEVGATTNTHTETHKVYEDGASRTRTRTRTRTLGAKGNGVGSMSTAATSGFNAEGTLLPLTNVPWDTEKMSFSFSDDVYVDLDSSKFQWGTGDFTLKMTVTPKEDNKVGGDDGVPYAALFIKSAEPNFPYTGPSCFINDDGTVRFRLAATPELGGDNVGQVQGGWKANVPVELSFIRQADKLFIYHGAQQLVVSQVTLNFNVDNSAPFRIGGNHVTATGQSMNAYLSGLASFDTAVFPQ